MRVGTTPSLGTAGGRVLGLVEELRCGVGALLAGRVDDDLVVSEVVPAALACW